MMEAAKYKVNYTAMLQRLREWLPRDIATEERQSER